MAVALTPKQRKFAEAYAGNATRAAELAGYSGSRAALGVRGHELLRHPEVAALIAARAGGRAKSEPVRAEDASDDDEDSAANVSVLEAIRDDDTALASHRIQAVERLERIKQRRLEREAAAGGGDALQRLRAKVTEVLRAKRRREEGEGDGEG